MVKNPSANTGDVGDMGSIPGSEDSLEECVATHFSTLAWRIPWTEEPGRLQSMELQRVGQDQATSLSLSLSGSRAQAQLLWSTGLAALRRVRSSQTRD